MVHDRGINPVLGVILMVVITLILASVVTFEVSTIGSGLEDHEDQYDDAVTTLSANPWSGSQGDLIRISNNQAGATDVKYRVNFSIEPGSPTIGDTLDEVYIEVTTGSPNMFSNTELADLISVKVDQGNDGTYERTLSGDADVWQVQNGGTSLQIDFSSSYHINSGSSIIVVFDSVDNPDTPGEFELRVETNNAGNWHTGTITIVD